MEFFKRTVQDYHLDSLQDASNLSILIAVVTSLILILSYYILKDKDIPPGPTGLPLLGYWPFLNSERCPLQLIKMKKKYGDIFSFRITGQLYINLASFKVLREAHITKSDCFTERSLEYNLLGKIFENGVVYLNGDKWQSVRKFFVNQFRERGMTIFKENTAEAMDETITDLVEDLRKKSGKPLDILKILERNGNRIIRHTFLGANTPVTEREIQNVQDDYRAVTNLIHSTNMVLIGKIARYFIMPFLPGYREAMKTHRNVKNALLKIIDEHKKTFDEDNIRDIIDSYIKERNTRRSKGDITAEHFTDESLAANLLQFVGDGANSVALFVTMCLKTLLDNPEEQEKIYQELVEICGEDRNPGFADKSKLTYTNAFLLEAQRSVSFVPIFPSLLCTRETTVGGYRIPEGAITLSNIDAIHSDPQVYENPEKFDPSRFITKEGKSKPETPITFGVGKRVCLGESFVLMELFHIITAIVKNFQICYSRPKSYYQMMRSRTLEIIVTPRK